MRVYPARTRLQRVIVAGDLVSRVRPVSTSAPGVPLGVPPEHTAPGSESWNSAPGRIRTSDTQIRSLVLYPLSYGRAATDHSGLAHPGERRLRRATERVRRSQSVAFTIAALTASRLIRNRLRSSAAATPSEPYVPSRFAVCGAM